MLPWTIVYKFLGRHLFLGLLSIYLRVEILGPEVVLYITFWEITRVFSKLAVPFYTSNGWQFQFLHVLANCYCLCNCIPSSRCEAVSHCVFICISLLIYWCWASCHVLIGHLYMICRYTVGSPYPWVPWIWRTIVPFYPRDLSIRGIGVWGRTLEPVPCGYQGRLYSSTL